MINNTTTKVSGIGSGVLNRIGSNQNVRKVDDMMANNRSSIEDFQNAEREIADKMKSEILMKKNPSIGELSQNEDPHNEQVDDQQQLEQSEGEQEEEEDYEMKFPSKYHNQ